MLGLLSKSLNAWNDISAVLLLWSGGPGLRMGARDATLNWGSQFTSWHT